ncbi:MAG: hypothetical protein ACOCG5_04255 [Candidatus Alkaliphilus sp. MAG34]
MTIENVCKVFMGVVERLDVKAFEVKRKPYVETRGGDYWNYKPTVFRKGLEEIGVGKEEVEFYLSIFRSLGFLVTSEGAFTSMQKINGRMMRVVTVRKTTVETLKRLGFDGKEV